MDDDAFNSELAYQASLSIAEALLRAGLLTDREFAMAKALLLATHRPPIGSMLAEPG